MPKSYKLLGDGNYIDSTGIAHNKVALNTVITNLQNADISAINNLTSTDTKNALAAAQGKVLNEKIANAATAVILYDLDSDADKYAKLISAVDMFKDSANRNDMTLNKPILYEIDTDENSNTRYYLSCEGISGNNTPMDNTYEFNFSFKLKNAERYIDILLSTDTQTLTITDSGLRFVGSVENVLTSTSTSNSLSANQGKILNDKITALTARVAALEAGEIELATDPTDTDEMNVWIQTS